MSMTETINKKDLFISLKESISCENLRCYEKEIASAIKAGYKRIFFDFIKVDNMDNVFLDFVLNIKDNFNSINFYNIDMSLLPAFYLMKIDNIADVYTSQDDAIKEQKPIIKRRLSVL